MNSLRIFDTQKKLAATQIQVRSVGEEWQKRGELMMQDPPVVSWQWGNLSALGKGKKPRTKKKSDMIKRCEDILFKDFFRIFIGICMSYGSYDEFS